MEPREERITVNGTTLHVRVWGEGPPMLLIHGGPGASGSYWWPTVDYLGLYRTVYAVDLRGHGKSARDPPYGIRVFAADLKALMDKLDAGSYTLLGHSYGTTVALELAASDRRCAELVMVGGFHSTWRMIVRPRKVWTKLKLVWSLLAWNLGWGKHRKGPEVFMRALLRRARPLLEDDASHSTSVEATLLDSAEEPLDAVYPLQKDILTWRIGDRIHAIRARTLVVVGEHDHMGAPETGFFGRHLDDVHLVTVKGSGHSPFIDAPEVFRRLLTDFLASRMPEARELLLMPEP